MKVPEQVEEPGLLALALSLYGLAIGWAALAGPGSFLAGLLSGTASIITGVWLGLWFAHRRGYSHTHDDDDDTPGPIHHI